jgi:hypothetical protein
VVKENIIIEGEELEQIFPSLLYSWGTKSSGGE